MAPEIFENVVLSGDDCHWIVPVLPLRVNTVLLVPVQTVVAPVIDPATEVGFTVIVTLEVVAEEQTPLVETAL